MCEYAKGACVWVLVLHIQYTNKHTYNECVKHLYVHSRDVSAEQDYKEWQVLVFHFQKTSSTSKNYICSFPALQEFRQSPVSNCRFWSFHSDTLNKLLCFEHYRWKLPRWKNLCNSDKKYTLTLTLQWCNHTLVCGLVVVIKSCRRCDLWGAAQNYTQIRSSFWCWALS